eukprot:SAG22_NODE_48_length_24654_cov_4.406394_12_plen_64_part_00
MEQSIHIFQIIRFLQINCILYELGCGAYVWHVYMIAMVGGGRDKIDFEFSVIHDQSGRGVHAY